MNDKSKNLDGMPAIKPARDEVAMYRRTNRSEAPKQSNFNGLLVFSLVLMAIMMGVGGFTLYEVQQRLDESNKILEQANRNVRDLESRLEATGSDVSRTILELKGQQATNFSEIDKLWRIAYRENRPKIQELEQGIATVIGDSKKLVVLNASIMSDLDKVVTGFNTLFDDMTGLQENITAEAAETSSQVSKVRGQIQDQADLVERNRRELSSLDNKVEKIEDAIKVFDRSRQLVNQRLLDLQNQIQNEPAAGH